MNLVPIPLCSNLGCKGRCLVAVIGPKFHSLAKKSSRIVIYVYHLKVVRPVKTSGYSTPLCIRCPALQFTCWTELVEYMDLHLTSSYRPSDRKLN